MPILPLPDSTVRLLGSTVDITSSCSLVKELIDNALDATATSIEVLISADTIGKVQIRDNGQGIDVGDFDALGRRAHTSKLSNFDELRMKGGQTLGFRGEALASANSLSIVVITTKMAVDPVATRLQLTFGVGGVQSRRPISAPVGTTVLVTNLFHNVPARKQFALKERSKTMSRIRELLKGYVLARPYLKLCLKVVGEPGSSWSYAPTNPATVRDVVLQVFGKDVASNCVEITFSSSTNEGNHQTDFVLDTLIPRPCCDSIALKSRGTFISIDSRPISSTTKFAKKILKIMKSYVSKVLEIRNSAKVVGNTFLQLNIRCPPCAYDANVTPLKDEVLFADEKSVLECFEMLCKRTYVKKDLFVRDNESTCCDREYSSLISSDIPTNKNTATLQDSKSNSLQLTPTKTTKYAKLDSPSLTMVSMRTKNTVCMNRTDSNYTDEDSSATLIEVQVPPWRGFPDLPIAEPPPQLRTIAGEKMGIERYFQPKQIEDFDILVDETATSGEKDKVGGDLTISEIAKPGPIRQPLQPLSKSVLNRMQGHINISNDSSDSDIESIPPHSDLISAPTRGSIGGILHHPALLGLRSPSPQHRGSPVGRHVTEDFQSPPALIMVSPLSLSTPPSSDPQHRGRRANPPFRHVMAGTAGREHSTLGRRREGNRSTTIHSSRITPPRILLSNRADIDWPNGSDARVSGVDLHRRVGENGEEQQHQPLQTGSSNGSFFPNRGNAEDGNQQQLQTFQTGNRFDSFTTSGINESERTQRRANRRLSKLPETQDPAHGSLTREQQVPLPGSPPFRHASQILLMKTPPVSIASDSRHEKDGLHLDIDSPSQERELVSAPHTGHLASDRIVSPSFACDQDPRRYLIRRQKSRACWGRPRRLPSCKLPLETIPVGEEMQHVSTTIQLQLGELESWMDMPFPGESDTYEEHPALAGLLRRALEVEEIGKHLQGLVDEHVKTMHGVFEVEYTPH